MADLKTAIRSKLDTLAAMESEYSTWLPAYRELSLYYLPRTYAWLSRSSRGTSVANSDTPIVSNRPSAASVMSSKILNSAGTEALRVLAHGLMNGITSPARPWFRLRLAGFPESDDAYPHEYLIWLDTCTHRMQMVLAESNFYNAMAVQYLDLSLFGTSALLIYEDFEEVIRCYNMPTGEYNLTQSNRRKVEGCSRVYNLTISQLEQEFGYEAMSEQSQKKFDKGGSALQELVLIYHIVEPNTRNRKHDEHFRVASVFSHREVVWEASSPAKLLRKRGFYEDPLAAPRWEVMGNDSYGTAPAWDALPDVKQLQVAAKQRVQAKDKMNRPPIVADQSLQGDPTALLPGGVSYVSSASTFGAKALYTVNPPLAEMTAEIAELAEAIRRHFYNNLFRNVSNLETVRSATEVMERKAEDMVLLGSILERFENESLDPIIKRVFGVMFRKGLLPPPPPGLDPGVINIRYVSILADAQRAINTGSIERFLAAVGQLGGLAPDTLDIPDFEELLREYAARLNVPPKGIRGREELAQLRQQKQQQRELQEAALVGNELTSAAKNLSETEVGGGASVLDQLL